MLEPVAEQEPAAPAAASGWRDFVRQMYKGKVDVPFEDLQLRAAGISNHLRSLGEEQLRAIARQANFWPEERQPPELPTDDECSLMVRLKEGEAVTPGELTKCVGVVEALYQFRRVKARETLAARGVSDPEVLQKHLDWAVYVEKARARLPPPSTAAGRRTPEPAPTTPASPPVA